MKQAIVKIEKLNKSFKDKGVIFNNLNLEIYPKEHFAIVARNGIGKTVLLETLVGLRKVNKGKINWNFNFKVTPYEKIGYLFQKDNLSKNFYVKDYIEILEKDKNVDNNFLEQLIVNFEIEKIFWLKISSLSGGQKQILKVIITFVYKYEVIILDEFDNNLDVEIKKQLVRFIKNYAKEYESTIILVSHDFEDIKQICNKIGFLANHKIEQIESVKDMTFEKFKRYLSNS